MKPADMTLWRAGCGGTRTSGSEGGPGKRAKPKGWHRAPARPNQAKARWGRAADGFLTLFGAKLALGGISDRDTLAQLSYLAGNYNATYKTRNGHGFDSGWSETIQQRPRLAPELIATLTPGWAYLAHTNHRPHIIGLCPPPPPRPRFRALVRLAAWVDRIITGGASA